MADKPDCDICGQPYHRHMEICGMGRVCPASGFTYRAKRPEAADEITRLNAENERARNDALEEAARIALYWVPPRSAEQGPATANEACPAIAAAIRALVTKASRDSGHG